jgi:hypothetical protein
MEILPDPDDIEYKYKIMFTKDYSSFQLTPEIEKELFDKFEKEDIV